MLTHIHTLLISCTGNIGRTPPLIWWGFFYCRWLFNDLIPFLTEYVVTPIPAITINVAIINIWMTSLICYLQYIVIINMCQVYMWDFIFFTFKRLTTPLISIEIYSLLNFTSHHIMTIQIANYHCMWSLSMPTKANTRAFLLYSSWYCIRHIL